MKRENVIKEISYAFVLRFGKSFCIMLLFFFISCKTEKFAIVKLNDKCGTINKKGEFVIEPIWDWIFKSNKSELYLVRKDSLYGYIDISGKVIIKPQYIRAQPFSEGLAAVSNGKKYGFINSRGDTIIPFIYDETFMGFNNGLSDVTLCDSCGFINKKGKIVIPLIYKTCYPFMSKYAQVQTFDMDYLVTDKKGKTYNEDEINDKYRLWVPRNRYPGSFSTSTGRGRINIKGDTIVPPLYLVTGNLSDRMYIVQDKNKKWGAYNDKGQLVVIPQFDDIWHFHEGVANFKLNDKWGYVNKIGQIVIEPIFDYARQFTNGIAYVELDGKVGFINKKGEFIIKPIFQVYRLGGDFE